MFKELNSKRTIREGIELEHLPFIKLKELAGYTLKVDGFFFTDSKFGRQVVVVAGGMKINMPNRAIDLFDNIRSNDQLLDALINGRCLITNIRVVETKNGSTTLFELADNE